MSNTSRKPFFYDITLRDGNQALKQPWNLKEKERVFNLLLDLGVHGIELGFSAASDMDFEAVKYLAKKAPENVIVSTLARAVEYDINKAYESIKYAKKPRIHTFIALSPLSMKYVLKKEPLEVRKQAVEMVKYAKSLLGENGEVQFSVEHFGDCRENLDFVIESILEVIDAGATIINLPNTVERFRTMIFVNMVKKVVDAVGDKATVSVHNHNDLGQATATTVESFYAGATQLETSLNGLGERAGNTNMYEVAVSLLNCGTEVDINFEKIYETALIIEEMSGVKIPDKAPLIGAEALAHRSGIHQDGSIKTKEMKKGAYRPIDPELIGRKGELLEFTSQSGKNSIIEILNSVNWPISTQEATKLQPILKKVAEEKGVLSPEDIMEIYEKNFMNIEGPIKILKFEEIDKKNSYHKYSIEIDNGTKIIKDICEGDGPIDAVINLFKSTGKNLKLEEYNQVALDATTKGASARALTTIKLLDKDNDKTVIGRGVDYDTSKANILAVISAMNILYKDEN